MSQQPHQLKARWQVTSFFTALLVGFSSMTVYAQPAWWAEKGVIDANAEEDNYAAANAGQLKHMVTQAAEHFTDQGIDVPTETQTMLDAWENSTANNYAAINIGQLKHTSKPFWDYLISNNATNSDGAPYTYPWTPNDALDDNNYALANIGQLKNAFNFTALDAVNPDDTDNDGLLDSWEIQYFGDLVQNGNGDYDRDGITNLVEFQNETDPTIDENDLDDDGLPDDWEQQIIDYDTADGINSVWEILGFDDFDGDGLSNLAEFQYGTDPTTNNDIDIDTDGDGIPDFIENLVGLDPNSSWDALGDLDGDGVSNIDEYLSNGEADLKNIDTNEDSVPDGQTIDPALDLDFDCLASLVELRRYNTSPLSLDSDSDTVPDWLEAEELSLDPADSSDVKSIIHHTGISWFANYLKSIDVIINDELISLY